MRRWHSVSSWDLGSLSLKDSQPLQKEERPLQGLTVAPASCGQPSLAGGLCPEAVMGIKWGWISTGSKGLAHHHSPQILPKSSEAQPTISFALCFPNNPYVESTL